MRRHDSIVFAGAAAIAAIGAATVIAQTTAQQPPATAASGGQASLVSAIQIAEQQTGGKARKAELERDDGVDAYEVKTVARDKSAKVVVELVSGKVLRIERPSFFENIANVFDDEDRREDQAALTRLDASPMTLSAAISAAERETGGRAVKAALKSQYGATLFEVGVVKDLVRQKVLIEPASGKVVPAPAKGKKEDDD